jgi:hypothetical protein
MERQDLRLGEFHYSALLIQADLKEYNIQQLTDKFFQCKTFLYILRGCESTIDYKLINCNLRLIKVVINKRQDENNI